MADLFGPAPEPKKRGKHYVRPRGFARPPGTGPQGETCGSCRHISRTQSDSRKVYPKCKLTQAKWTRGGATDIRVRSPACEKWERIDD